MGLAALFVACHDEEESPQIPITVRTVFMYLVADNDISGDIYNNIASVEDGLKKGCFSRDLRYLLGWSSK